ncbi:hypothetical protein NB639_01355 [Oxalobacter formigenes]|uniref:hypothetical protein n=1 Tax=Oxalobacter formigenes TaxID=847 RepID=UPI0022AF830E|nr:hypothetical protein [Oxalobacter formigenes]WAW06078.1 hypothetical protein NB639_01355 [Oxalobacter formigenes]
MTTSWKWVTGLILLAVAFCAGWIINGWRLNASFQEEKAKVVRANADHFADVSKMVNEEATTYKSNSNELSEKIVQLKKELSNAQKNDPVSSDCRPDADRLRILKSAVTAANTAARQ